MGEEPEHWLNRCDPERSAAYVRETVEFAQADGPRFDYKVWAEEPQVEHIRGGTF